MKLSNFHEKLQKTVQIGY